MKHYTEEQKSIIRSIDIAKYTPKAALYEQLAEEASELSQAAIKCARCIRKESYTSRTMEECEQNLIEELSDVKCCADALQISHSDEIVKYKTFRWKQRIYEYSSAYKNRGIIVP